MSIVDSIPAGRQSEYFIKTPDNKRIPVPENRVAQVIKSFEEGNLSEICYIILQSGGMTVTPEDESALESAKLIKEGVLI